MIHAGFGLYRILSNPGCLYNEGHIYVSISFPIILSLTLPVTKLLLCLSQSYTYLAKTNYTPPLISTLQHTMSSSEPQNSSSLPSEDINNDISINATSTNNNCPNTTQAKVAKPKKKSKKLCQYKQCTSPHSIIGDCSFCFKKFCTRHRLLESHDCEHYRDVQKDYHDRNAKQLQNQQTVISKV